MSQPPKKATGTTKPTPSATKATQPATKTTSAAKPATKPTPSTTKTTPSTTKPATKPTQSATKTTPSATKPTQSTGKKPTPKNPATTAKEPIKEDKQKVKEDVKEAAELLEKVKVEEKKAEEINISLGEIAKVIFDDSTNKIETTKKWPLVLDKNGNVETFMRYRDVNFIDTFNPSNMEPERIRMAILGAIRFGKEFVVYTHDQLESMWSIFSEKLNAIHPTLLLDIMTRKIIEDDYYKNLIREEDGDEYNASEFNKSQMYELNKKFKFVLLTNDEQILPFRDDWVIITVN